MKVILKKIKAYRQVGIDTDCASIPDFYTLPAGKI